VGSGKRGFGHRRNCHLWKHFGAKEVFWKHFGAKEALIHDLASVRMWVSALSAALRCGREARLASAGRERRLSVAFWCGGKGGAVRGMVTASFRRCGCDATGLRLGSGVASLRWCGGFRGAVGGCTSVQTATKPRREEKKCQWIDRQVSGGRVGGGNNTSVEWPKRTEVQERSVKGRAIVRRSSDSGRVGRHGGHSVLRNAVEAERLKRNKQSSDGGRRGGSRDTARFGGWCRDEVNLESTLKGNEAQGRTGQRFGGNVGALQRTGRWSKASRLATHRAEHRTAACRSCVRGTIGGTARGQRSR